MSLKTKPVKQPRWATDGGGQIVEPTEGRKNTGWNPAEEPPAQNENWFKNLIFLWSEYFESVTDFFKIDDSTVVQSTEFRLRVDIDFYDGALPAR